MIELTRGEGRLPRVRRRSKGQASSGEKASTTPGMQVPKMTSDARRSFIAFIVSIIPGTLFDELLERTDFGFDELMSDVAILVCSLLVGWFFFATIYAALTFFTFARADGETLVHWLRESTPRTRFARFLNITSGGSSTIWTIHGSLIAVFAALVLSLVPELRTSPVVMISGITAIAASWLLNAVSFAIHYARKDTTTRGFLFPGDTVPTFSDYLYLAVQVSTTYSSSDVITITTPMRRAVTVHNVIAFTFNTVIIAILVSVLISAAA